MLLTVIAACSLATVLYVARARTWLVVVAALLLIPLLAFTPPEPWRELLFSVLLLFAALRGFLDDDPEGELSLRVWRDPNRARRIGLFMRYGTGAFLALYGFVPLLLSSFSGDDSLAETAFTLLHLYMGCTGLFLLVQTRRQQRNTKRAPL